MNNVFAVSTNTYHGFSLIEALEGISRAGFSWVELTAVKGYTEHVNWQMTDAELDQVKKEMARFNLQAISLSGHSNILTEEGLDLFMHNIDLARRLGCRYVITATGETHDDDSELSDPAGLLSSLQRVVEQCEKNQLIVCLETHGNIFGSGVQMLDLVNRIPSPALGINYDTANAIFYGNVRPEDDLPRCIQRVSHLHLKDKLGTSQEWNFPALGKGNIDFRRIFQILQQHSYQGPFSVEVEFTSSGPQSLDEVNQATADSFATIQTIIKSL